MKDERCAVEVGVHPAPYWIGTADDGREVLLCDRHKRQMQERDDLSPLTYSVVRAGEET